MSDRLLRDLILEYLEVYSESTLADIIEYVWRDKEADYDYVPEKEVQEAIVGLANDSEILWDETTKVALFDVRSARAMVIQESVSRTVMKWRATIIGSFEFIDDEVDIERVRAILMNRQENFGLGTVTYDYSADRGEISMEWIHNESRCEARWDRKNFHIHSYVFEEPSPEIVRYIGLETAHRREFLLQTLPLWGAMFIYSFMKQVMIEAMPGIRFKIGNIDTILTRRG